MNALIDIAKHAVMITGFVFVMMLVVEYINVLTHGRWDRKVRGRRWLQYLLAVLLGASPGCLGAFAVVAMYSHGTVSLGAVAAAMIATSGDESFVMLAMIPEKAFLFFGLLAAIGLIVGALADLTISRRWQHSICEGMEVHEEACHCFEPRIVLPQWKQCSLARGVLSIVLAALLAAFALGEVGPASWNWIRVTLLLTTGAALFIVVTVPEHFLEEHLWHHVALSHVPHIFLWTVGALLLMHILIDHMDLKSHLIEGKWVILLLACLVGLIPESGPHLVFLTLYAEGAVPFSVFLASSIVQDGHGMLPLLAHSRKGFFAIKGINFLFGLVLGSLAMSMGF